MRGVGNVTQPSGRGAVPALSVSGPLHHVQADEKPMCSVASQATVHVDAPFKGAAPSEDRPLPPRQPVCAEVDAPTRPSHADVSLASLGTTFVRDLFVLEVCAGSAVLSSVLSSLGFRALAVDYGGNKHRPYFHIMKLDLRLDSSWEFLQYVLDNNLVFYVHGAPPCGTASRARYRRLSTESHGPPPLRSAEFPWGLPGVSERDHARLACANAVYERMAAFMELLCERGIHWALENPGRSYFWELPCIVALRRVAIFVDFHVCEHGGERKKLTALLTTLTRFSALQVFCSGQHEHQGWGLLRHDAHQIFATSLEAEYPRLLCQRMGHLLLDEALAAGYSPAGTLAQAPLPDQISMAVGAQPRGSKSPALIPEFMEVRVVHGEVADMPPLNGKQQLTSPWCGIPAGSKLVRFTPDKGGETGARAFGIYHSAIEFTAIARSLEHPYDYFAAVPDVLLSWMALYLGRGPVWVAKYRLRKIMEWRELAKGLEQKEAELHASLEPGVREILKGKRLLLLERLAGEIGWPDKCLHSDIRNGFALVGLTKPSHVFPKDVKPLQMGVDQLEMQYKFQKPMLWGKVAGGTADEGVWDATCDEANEKCWLKGPFSYAQLEDQFCRNWTPVRRFGIQQSGKLRVIDDHTENGTNLAYASCEKLDLKALDHMVWMSVCIAKALMHRGHYELRLRDGTVLQGPVEDVEAVW